SAYELTAWPGLRPTLFSTVDWATDRRRGAAPPLRYAQHYQANTTFVCFGGSSGARYSSTLPDLDHRGRAANSALPAYSVDEPGLSPGRGSRRTRGAGPGRHAPARPDHPRPGAAGYRWVTRDRAGARVGQHADRCALGQVPGGRQGRRAG